MRQRLYEPFVEKNSLHKKEIDTYGWVGYHLPQIAIPSIDPHLWAFI
jgi:hypothetical protein